MSLQKRKSLEAEHTQEMWSKEEDKVKPLGIFTSHCGNLEGSYGGASRPSLRALGDVCVRDGPV